MLCYNCFSLYVCLSNVLLSEISDWFGLLLQVDFAHRPLMVFCRLSQPAVMADLSEIALPTRFVFLCLTPMDAAPNAIWEISEMGRSLGSMLGDKVTNGRHQVSGTETVANVVFYEKRQTGGSEALVDDLRNEKNIAVSWLMNFSDSERTKCFQRTAVTHPSYTHHNTQGRIQSMSLELRHGTDQIVGTWDTEVPNRIQGRAPVAGLRAMSPKGGLWRNRKKLSSFFAEMQPPILHLNEEKGM